MNDKEQIENVVQLYIDCMDESNPDKVKEAFHENSTVVDICMESLCKCQWMILLVL